MISVFKNILYKIVIFLHFCLSPLIVYVTLFEWNKLYLLLICLLCIIIINGWVIHGECILRPLERYLEPWKILELFTSDNIENFAFVDKLKSSIGIDIFGIIFLICFIICIYKINIIC